VKIQAWKVITFSESSLLAASSSTLGFISSPRKIRGWVLWNSDQASCHSMTNFFAVLLWEYRPSLARYNCLNYVMMMSQEKIEFRPPLTAAIFMYVLTLAMPDGTDHLRFQFDDCLAKWRGNACRSRISVSTGFAKL
jgi:hypothetical protein